MSLGHSPLSATLSIKTRASSRTSRNPFRASCLFAPLFPPPASSPSVAGPSRLQGRPISIDSSRSVSKRTRTRELSKVPRAGGSIASDSSSSCCLPPKPSRSLSPPPPSSSLRRSSYPHLPSPCRIPALSSIPPPPTNRKPPPWTRSTQTTSSLTRRPFPLHSQQHQLLTTLASSQRSLLLQRALSTTSSLPKATPAPDALEEQPLPLSEARDVAGDEGPPSVLLHEEQEAILQKVLLGESCFLSGAAGSGKSVLLRAMIAALESRGKTVGITATTGIAAQSLDPLRGRTIHGWSGIVPGDSDAKKVVERKSSRSAGETWRSTDVLIVDEISMMSDSFMNLLSNVGKLFRGDSSPFGGVQIIFAGDFAQLPPVITDNSSENGNKHFAFTSNAWIQALPASKCHFLEHAHRQKDPRFSRMLDRMRFGEHTVRDVNLLENLAVEFEKNSSIPGYSKYTDGIEPTFLCPNNAVVDEHNSVRLANLGDVEGYKYSCVDDNAGAVKKLESSEHPRLDSLAKVLKRLTEETSLLREFELKVGARVMVVQNHQITRSHILRAADGEEMPSIELDTHNGDSVHLADAVSGDSLLPKSGKARSGTRKLWLYNGMQGIVEKFVPYKAKPSLSEEKLIHEELIKGFNMVPVVRFTNGSVVQVDPLLSKYGGSQWKPDATRKQIPLKLAWAMSIHKSQGQTLERAKMDLGDPWEVGQTYVALSRATSLETLEITRFDRRRVFTDPSVRAFYQSFRRKPAVALAEPVASRGVKTLNVVDSPSSIPAIPPPSPVTVPSSTPSPPFPWHSSRPTPPEPITLSESPFTAQTPLHPSPDRTFPSPRRPRLSLERTKRSTISAEPTTPSEIPLHPSPERSTDPYPAFYIPSPTYLDPSFSERQRYNKLKEILPLLENGGRETRRESGSRLSYH